MPKPKMLFTAPVDFDLGLWNRYQETFDMVTDGAEVWVCNPKQPYTITGDYLDRNMPGLRLLATPSTGTNHIDLEACKQRGVKTLSLLDDRDRLETIRASSEFTFKLLLDALRAPPARELHGRYVGLIGYGRIGRNIARWCFAFGAHALANDPHVETLHSYPLKKLFKECDAIVVCCALNDETRGLITGDLLRLMQPRAILVNTARGEVIVEDDLVEVLQERRDLRVMLDVVSGEATGTQRPERLQELGAIVTPHIAGETYDSRTKAAHIIYGLIRKETETWGVK